VVAGAAEKKEGEKRREEKRREEKRRDETRRDETRRDETRRVDRFTHLEGYPSGQREQTVNLPALAFGGSNPPPSTPGFSRE
jgi:hypothetical protein